MTEQKGAKASFFNAVANVVNPEGTTGITSSL